MFITKHKLTRQLSHVVRLFPFVLSVVSSDPQGVVRVQFQSCDYGVCLEPVRLLRFLVSLWDEKWSVWYDKYIWR